MTKMRFLTAFILCLALATPVFAEEAYRGEPAAVPTGARIVKGRTIDKCNPYAFTAGQDAAVNARKQFEANAEAYRAARTQKSTGEIEVQKPKKPLMNVEKNKSCLNGNYSDCY